MAEYPPYVNHYGGIPKLFEAIRHASVPPKFTQDFIESVLGFKSTSYRAMIPFLKRLGFLDQGNVPTESYRQFRDDSSSGVIMAQQIRAAYADLYKASEYAHKLSKEEVTSKLATVLGVKKDDDTLKAVVASFLELRKLANFDYSDLPASESSHREETEEKIIPERSATRLGLSYTINLNLPATTDVNVFNAIFKSLKEHILNG